jgi:hypothetical protein
MASILYRSTKKYKLLVAEFSLSLRVKMTLGVGNFSWVYFSNSTTIPYPLGVGDTYL